MKMNERSSRGHALITISVREVSGDGAGRVGKLTLVDLAGMESSKKSYAIEGASKDPVRQEEVRHINQSLWALGTVIERLSSSGPGGHIPYRDSKLTRMLQLSLVGGGKMAFIATLRNELLNLDESVGTLRFAQRCKAIRVVVKRGATVMDPEMLQKMYTSAQVCQLVSSTSGSSHPSLPPCLLASLLTLRSAAPHHASAGGDPSLQGAATRDGYCAGEDGDRSGDGGRGSR